MEKTTWHTAVRAIPETTDDTIIQATPQTIREAIPQAGVYIWLETTQIVDFQRPMDGNLEQVCEFVSLPIRPGLFPG
jgi:hypothetical protein